ncbi:MAG: hypothetical protein JNJ57_19890 [Saprospiraceae bacterium]|nr:hypothetical protein [Saprospiraceae bacterium]
MTIKILFALFLLLACAAWLYCSPSKRESLPEKPIDQVWWDALSEEWKTILRINQYFYRNRVDFYQIQQEYLNRMNGPEDANHTALNTSLRDLNEKQKFLLSYNDMYARVRKKFPSDSADTIDLGSLHLIDKIYMVSGPGDLTPLKKFAKLKVLVANYCGINHSVPHDEQVLNLEPLRKLSQLEHLHCVSPALKSLEPLKDLTNLTYLDCENSDVTTLAPLKNLHRLERLFFGSKVENASVIARLTNLKTLHIAGCKEIPDLSTLQKLQELCLIENELALVNSRYRISELGFLKNLSALEFLDFDLTSYRGNLADLNKLTRLKAVTLPRVPTSDMQAFKQAHPGCVVINEYEW